MKQYILVDRIEGFEVIYESNSIKDITKYAKYYDREVVDGECYLLAYERVREDRIRMIKDWLY